jgi:hypothetical protein
MDNDERPPAHITWIDLVIFAIPALILLPSLLVAIMHYPMVGRVLGTAAGAILIWEIVWRVNRRDDRSRKKRPPDDP